MRAIHYFCTLLALAGGFLFMPHAKAACTAPMMPYTIAIASTAVTSDLPVGSIIPGSDETVNIHGSCAENYSGMVIIGCYYGNGGEVAGFPGVYHTGVAGIGIALINDKGQRIIGGGVSCDTRNTPLGYVSSDGQNSYNFNVTLALVKISEDIRPGTLQQSQTQFGIGVFGRAPIGAPNTISYAGNVTFKMVTCSVSPQSLNITLGDFTVSQFTGVGSHTNWKNFIISATCDNTVEVGVKVASANGYDSGSTSTIKLTQEPGVATGIGVKVLTGGQDTNFGQYTKVGEITQENGTLNMLFAVQYYQIASSVTPGVANSVFTITVAYR